MDGFDRDVYFQQLEDLANSIPVNADLSDFDATGYMDGVNQKVQNMLDEFENFETIGDNRDLYLKQSAEFFIKGFMEDMEYGETTNTTQQYINDMDLLKNDYLGKLALLNADDDPQDPATSSGLDIPNPSENTGVIDASYGQTSKAMKIEFHWAGIGDHWLNNGVLSIMSIVETFQQRFAHDAVAQLDFQYMKDMWQPGAEVYGMNAAYDPSVYDDAGNLNIWRNKQAGQYQSSYVIDSDGAPSDPEAYQDDFDQASTLPSVNTLTANNRSWGYRYNNGSNKTISVTLGKNTYSLQESVYTSPLVLDLDNDGEIEASGGYWLPHTYRDSRLAEFDMDGDGFIDLCEWVGPNDGILLTYDGGYVDANNFFGWAGGFAHGFEKLSLLDENGDGQIAGEELDTLSVWQDLNVNAQVDEGEISSVADMGISMISLRHDSDLVSSFVQNGESKRVVDWHPCVFTVRRTR